MKKLLLASLAAVALAPAVAFAQATPAATPAQAPQKQMVPGLAIANVQDVVVNSNAVVNAAKERQIVYKDQLAMAEARRKQINAQIQPLVAKLNADRQAGNVAQAELQRQAQAIQNLQQAGVRELQTMLAPVTLSENYVQEQVNDAIGKAITSAMDKRGVTFVVPANGTLAFNNAYNLSPTILSELNALLPVAKVAPPQGWQPRAVRDAQAAQQAQLQGQGAAAEPAKPGKRPQGR
jgi:Skp family chaperone for outer membrane proteins